MDLEISPEEVRQLRERQEQFILLDVREPWEHQTARIEGAKLIPMADVPSRVHQELDPEERIVGVPSWGALTECGQLAAAAGIRTSAVHARRH
jgi:rhodanese-related sulfurtransferase